MARIDEELIVGIDPSSTATGIARVMGGRVVDLELVRPPAKMPAVQRSAVMAERVSSVLLRRIPRFVIIEVPGPRVAGRRRRVGEARGFGLTVYGMAVGMILWAAGTTAGPTKVLAVREDVWTEGKPKGARLELLRVQCADYRAYIADGGDKGGDVGDALALATWLDCRLKLVDRSGGSLRISDLDLVDLAVM